jgi:nucleoside-diphosphate-sugar epimerase
MIVGSGLLAKAFSPKYSNRNDVCIYAAGVSNSGCVDLREFSRERERLEKALKQRNGLFVYFGTCSVSDPEMLNMPYVQHKLCMENLVMEQSECLIIRCPQLAGLTNNPHTLLNFLYSRISRGESFHLWSKATRNIIDVADIVLVGSTVIDQRLFNDCVINIASPKNYTLIEIVKEMELSLGKRAIFDYLDCGQDYEIDVCAVLPLYKLIGLNFGEDYLKKVIEKYYHVDESLFSGRYEVELKHDF